MKKVIFASLVGLMSLTACDKDGDINLFSLEDDKELGKQLSTEIANNPSEYPILDPVKYADAYGYLYDIRDRILNSGKVNLRDEFDWEVKIIQDDDVLNAFCAPGGYIYVYTGIIKYLDSEYALAGVLGHEIAHADKRHSSDRLTREYGVSLALDVVLGKNQGALTDMARSLATLSYGRNQEREADEYSVIYLCETEYQADGAARFFESIAAGSGSSGGGLEEFLSTHPDPGERVQNITSLAEEKSCSGDRTIGDYEAFKNALP